MRTEKSVRGGCGHAAPPDYGLTDDELHRGAIRIPRPSTCFGGQDDSITGGFHRPDSKLAPALTGETAKFSLAINAILTAGAPRSRRHARSWAMRIATILVSLAVSALAPQVAHACKPFGPGFDSPAPTILWSAPPPVSILAPGDSVLRVAFKRVATYADPQAVDYDRDLAPHERDRRDIVIITCFAPSIYTVLEVVAGEDPGGSVLMWGLHARGDGTEQYLVGPIAPLIPTARVGSHPAPDSPRYMIYPRGP